MQIASILNLKKPCTWFCNFYKNEFNAIARKSPWYWCIKNISNVLTRNWECAISKIIHLSVIELFWSCTRYLDPKDDCQVPTEVIFAEKLFGPTNQNKHHWLNRRLSRDENDFCDKRPSVIVVALAMALWLRIFLLQFITKRIHSQRSNRKTWFL